MTTTERVLIGGIIRDHKVNEHTARLAWEVGEMICDRFDTVVSKPELIIQLEAKDPLFDRTLIEEDAWPGLIKSICHAVRPEMFQKSTYQELIDGALKRDKSN